MTQEQMANKQSRTPPIHSTIKWNNSRRKNKLTTPILSEQHLLAFFGGGVLSPKSKICYQ
jgi:hypothetical protein